MGSGRELPPTLTLPRNRGGDQYGLPWLLVVLVVAACSPGPARPAESDARGQQEARAERTLNIAVRVEPPTIASRSLESGGVKVKTTTRMFNAGLDLVDDRGQPHPYLAEALPKLNTESWQIFPDNRMETRYRLRPGLTWHDGTAFSAEDYVFAWRAYSSPELGPYANSPPISDMEEVAAPDD